MAEDKKLDWEEAIDHCIDNFEPEEAKKRIKAYVNGLQNIFQQRLLQATKASLLNSTDVFEQELKKGVEKKSNLIIAKR